LVGLLQRVVAVKSTHRKAGSPYPNDLFGEVLAKVGYVKNAPSIGKTGTSQVFPEIFEQG